MSQNMRIYAIKTPKKTPPRCTQHCTCKEVQASCERYRHLLRVWGGWCQQPRAFFSSLARLLCQQLCLCGPSEAGKLSLADVASTHNAIFHALASLPRQGVPFYYKGWDLPEATRRGENETAHSSVLASRTRAPTHIFPYSLIDRGRTDIREVSFEFSGILRQSPTILLYELVDDPNIVPTKLNKTHQLSLLRF